MLFTLKRDATRSLGVAVALVLLAALARGALGLEWSVALDAGVLLSIAWGLGLVSLADATVHGFLLSVGGEAYRGTFDALVEYFQGQSIPAVIAGGLLAGAEELFFRGVVLLGLLQHASLPVPLAVLLAALAFGAAHYVPEGRLRWMTLWATVEGVLLGGLLVVTGSLLVPLVVHALHDVFGFALFAVIRGVGVEKAGDTHAD